jgi:signal transduction histidine kinase
VAKRVEAEPGAAAELLESARGELTGALAELRELARGLHPAVLERGLEPALAALAERAPLPVALDVRLDAEPPENIAATAYYVVAEALTNVARYAHASEASVHVTGVGETLELVVADDGVGGASARPGSGLEGLRDRVEAVGGTLEVRSEPGAGTTVRARLV